MEPGQNYLLLTVTYYWTGRVVSITPSEIVLDDAAQVFHTGQLEDCLTRWEVELCQAIPSGTRVIVPRQGTTAITWSGPLPRRTKRDNE